MLRVDAVVDMQRRLVDASIYPPPTVKASSSPLELISPAQSRLTVWHSGWRWRQWETQERRGRKDKESVLRFELRRTRWQRESKEMIAKTQSPTHRTPPRHNEPSEATRRWRKVRTKEKGDKMLRLKAFGASSFLLLAVFAPRYCAQDE